MFYDLFTRYIRQFPPVFGGVNQSFDSLHSRLLGTNAEQVNCTHCGFSRANASFSLFGASGIQRIVVVSGGIVVSPFPQPDFPQYSHFLGNATWMHANVGEMVLMLADDGRANARNTKLPPP
ncbi:MAG TPA: hypothetical protein VGJ20_43385 [Xanthobacteraceae bacterium]|jgi:hypothetical protein